MRPRFNFTGKLVTDPKIFNSKSGKPMATVGIPCSGGKDEPTVWINCIAMDTLAERLQDAHKGDEFILAGNITANEYNSNITPQVWLDTVRRPELPPQQRQPDANGYSSQEPPYDSGEIPF